MIKLKNILLEARGETREDYDPANYTGTNGIADKISLRNPVKADGSGDYKSPLQQLRPDAAKAFEEMESAYYAETGNIFGSAFSDGWRPYTVQYRIVDWDYFERKGIFKKIDTSTEPLPPEKRYKVAEPGTSNHGWGIAIDIHKEPQKWMKGPSKHGMGNRGEDFGWWWGEVTSEPHHFKFKPELYKSVKSKQQAPNHNPRGLRKLPGRG